MPYDEIINILNTVAVTFLLHKQMVYIHNARTSRPEFSVKQLLEILVVESFC